MVHHGHAWLVKVLLIVAYWSSTVYCEVDLVAVTVDDSAEAEEDTADHLAVNVEDFAEAVEQKQQTVQEEEEEEEEHEEEEQNSTSLQEQYSDKKRGKPERPPKKKKGGTKGKKKRPRDGTIPAEEPGGFPMYTVDGSPMAYHGCTSGQTICGNTNAVSKCVKVMPESKEECFEHDKDQRKCQQVLHNGEHVCKFLRGVDAVHFMRGYWTNFVDVDPDGKEGDRYSLRSEPLCPSFESDIQLIKKYPGLKIEAGCVTWEELGIKDLKDVEGRDQACHCTGMQPGTAAHTGSKPCTEDPDGCADKEFRGLVKVDKMCGLFENDQRNTGVGCAFRMEDPINEDNLEAQ